MCTAVARVKLVFGMTSDYKKKKSYVFVYTCILHVRKTMVKHLSARIQNNVLTDDPPTVLYMRFRSTLHLLRSFLVRRIFYFT